MRRKEILDREYWIKLARESRYNANLLAQQLQISRRQVGRYTQILFSCSAQAWLNEQRLSVAAKMLEKNSCIKAVASELGFKQANHFSREFKRVRGLSPAAFVYHNGLKKSG